MAQADMIAIQIPKSRWTEESAFIATAYFRLRSTAAAVTPTTVKYRIDCLKTGKELADWTTVSAASNVSIAITMTHNKIQDDGNRSERKQLIVEADSDLATQHRDKIVWIVENLQGTV